MSAKVWFSGLLAMASVALLPVSATAQIFTPTFMSPRSENSVGLYLSDFDPGDLAVEGSVRRSFGTYDLGVRGGIVDAGGTSATLGGELRSPLSLGTAPIDMALTAGVQALIGDLDLLGAQAGVSLGHTFVSSDLSITPYFHPRLALVDYTDADSDTEFKLLADLGADLDFQSRISLRIGIGLNDVGSNWGVGLVWR